jgi:Lsr2
VALVREVRLVDDLDGGTAEGPIQFALDGRRYTRKNARRLRDALAEYVGAAALPVAVRYSRRSISQSLGQLGRSCRGR